MPWLLIAGTQKRIILSDDCFLPIWSKFPGFAMNKMLMFETGEIL